MIWEPNSDPTGPKNEKKHPANHIELLQYPDCCPCFLVAWSYFSAV